MSISLRFYVDPGLTQLVSPFPINHRIDGQGEPQDFVFYLGSAEAGRRFQAESDPGVAPIAVSILNATPEWQPGTVYATGAKVRTTTKLGHRFEATVGGESGAVEPVWPLDENDTVVDGDVTWTNIGPIHESTEVALALTPGGLGSATPGAALPLGTEILSGAANAVEVHARIANAVDVIGQAEELRLATNLLVELPVEE